MRRPLAALLLIAAVVLGACGDDEEPTTTAATETASTSATTVAEEPAEQEIDEDEGFTIERADPGESVTETFAADPEKSLDLFFTSGDPDLACGRLATENLLSTAYGDVEGCRQAQVPQATPKSIEIKSVETSGDTTEAVVIPEGGPNDGFEHDVVLVREGDAWLVDSIEADIPAGP